jgi:ABC-type Fe3+-hydroxamate transport system substrate-binding protein
LFVLALASAIQGCGAAATTPGPIRIVDDAGDTARASRRAAGRLVDSRQHRLLFALRRCESRRTYGLVRLPAEALAVTNLGDGLQPNLEAVLAVTPDLVVLYRSAQNAAAAEQLRPRVATAQPLPTGSRMFPGTRGRSAPLGRAELADSLAARLREARRGRCSRRQRPVGADPRLGPAADRDRGGKFPSELVERAGGRNLFADLRRHPRRSVSKPSRRAIPI